MTDRAATETIKYRELLQALNTYKVQSFPATVLFLTGISQKYSYNDWRQKLESEINNLNNSQLSPEIKNERLRKCTLLLNSLKEGRDQYRSDRYDLKEYNDEKRDSKINTLFIGIVMLVAIAMILAISTHVNVMLEEYKSISNIAINISILLIFGFIIYSAYLNHTYESLSRKHKAKVWDSINTFMKGVEYAPNACVLVDIGPTLAGMVKEMNNNRNMEGTNTEEQGKDIN